jgi:hypothetical protein
MGGVDLPFGHTFHPLPYSLVSPHVPSLSNVCEWRLSSLISKESVGVTGESLDGPSVYIDDLRNKVRFLSERPKLAVANMGHRDLTSYSAEMSEF